MRTACIAIFLAGFALAIAAQNTAPDIADLKTRAAAGEVRAQVALGHAYEDGVGVPQNDALAAKWYRAAAEQGDPEGQNELGVMYRLGHGVEKDFAQAAHWYRKAAKQGYAPAMFNMATVYYNGDGVGVDDKTAYAWFVLADAAGSKLAADGVQRLTADMPGWKLNQAKFIAAEMLLWGQEVPANPSRALEMYKKLGAEGQPAAWVGLARLHIYGNVVPRDYNQAQQYCLQAAIADYAPGMACVAYLNASGALGPGHDTEAFMWYERAAKNGSAVGAFGLASMYAQGRGTKQDLQRAYMWLAIAAHAQKELAQVANQPLNALAQKLGAKVTKKMLEKAVEQMRHTRTGEPTLRSEDLEFPHTIKFEMPN